MKIEWVNEASGRSGLSVTEVGRYDGHPPLVEFWLDGMPIDLNQDRIAVASTLLYSRWTSGAMTFPKQVGAGTARAIIDFCKPTWVMPDPIDYGPKPIPDGEGTIRISTDFGHEKPHSSNGSGRRHMDLLVLPSDKYAGTIFSLDRLIVASNAWLFSGRGGLEDFYPYIAVATLYAADVRCETVEVGGAGLWNEPQVRKLRSLLASTGLNLDII